MTITYQQWEDYARHLEKQNLKAIGKSRSLASIQNMSNHCIEEICSTTQTMIVKKDWRQIMKDNSKV